MKTLKNTLAILLIAFISMNVNAQRELTKKELRKANKAFREKSREKIKNDVKEKNTLTSTNVNTQEKYKDYHENGKLKSEGQYDSNGKETGEWKKYNQYGYLTTIGKMESGNKTGAWKYYTTSSIKYPHFTIYRDNEAIEKLTSNCYTGNCKDGYGLLYVTGWGKTPKLMEGNFVNGKLNGKGWELKKLFSNEFRVEYVGDFKDGYYSGQGKLIEFIRIGKKVYYNSYEGDFKDGKRDGFGIAIIPKGRYEGFWKNDKEHGKAKVYDSTEKLLFDGEFVNGDPKETPLKLSDLPTLPELIKKDLK